MLSFLSTRRLLVCTKQDNLELFLCYPPLLPWLDPNPPQPSHHSRQAKPENLVDTFILLMPSASKTQHDLARICELKVGVLGGGGGDCPVLGGVLLQDWVVVSG